MELRQLRFFVAAAEAGTISRAAARCGVAQPSLSQQIINLEQRLGLTLFDRFGRGVVLTDAGRALLPRARRMLAEAQDIESRIRSELDDGRGRLAIGAIPTMAPYLLPELVASLRNDHPECEIIVREDLTQNLVDAVVDNQLDVAIMSSPVDHELVELEVIGREPLLVVAPATHPLCGSSHISLSDLRSQPTITLHEMHCLGRQIGEFCSARRLAGNVICRMTQIDTLLEFVRLRLGVSIVPAMAATTTRSRSADLRFLQFKREPPTREIALAWRSGRTRSRLARRFAESARMRLQLQDGFRLHVGVRSS